MKEINHYILPEFVEGTILLKTGVDYEVMLNYNSLTEEMIFISEDQKLAIDNNTLALIDTVYLEDKKFIAHDKKFLELLLDSENDLFVEYLCRIRYPGKPTGYGGTSQTAAVTSYSQIQSDGILYELHLPDEYETKPYVNYWVKKDGEMHLIANVRQLRRLFSDKKNVYDEYGKEHKVQFDNPESIFGLVKYLDAH